MTSGRLLSPWYGLHSLGTMKWSSHFTMCSLSFSWMATPASFSFCYTSSWQLVTSIASLIKSLWNKCSSLLIFFFSFILLSLQSRFMIVIGRVLCLNSNGGDGDCTQTLFSIYLPITASGCLMFAPRSYELVSNVVQLVPPWGCYSAHEGSDTSFIFPFFCRYSGVPLLSNSSPPKWKCYVPWTWHKSWEQVKNDDSAPSLLHVMTYSAGITPKLGMGEYPETVSQ